MFKKIISSIVIMTMILCQPFSAVYSANADDPVYTVSITNETKQTIKGFGVFPAFTDDFDASKAAAAKAIFDDLGIDTFRVELPGQAGYADASVNIQYLQPMLDIIKYGEQYGITKYTVHVWSPPAPFKTNNAISGKMPDGSAASLMQEHEQDYCDWIVNCFDYITKTAHLPAPMAFSIQNEPENAFDYQSCAYSQEQYIRVTKLMRKTLDENGYEDVILLAAEGGGYLSNPRWLGEGYSVLKTDEEFNEAVGAICTHSYVIQGYTKDEDVNQFVENASQFPDKDRWQTEFSNSSMLGRDKMIDRCIEAMRVFAADMEWAGINYWSWWLGWNSSRLIDIFEQETLIEGDGVSSVRKSQHYYAFEKIYNSVDVGAKVAGVTSDDPELVNKIGQQTDLCAFTDGKKNTLMLINTSEKAKTYKFTNLLGTSAEIYNLKEEESDYRPDLLRRSNIINKEIAPISIPGRSITIITTSSEDMAPPLISMGDNPDLFLEDGVYVSRNNTVNVEMKVDEKATVMFDKKEIPLEAGNKFTVQTKLTTAVQQHRIDAIDANGNYADPLFIDLKYDPNCVTLALENCPSFTNSDTIVLKGRTNVDASVFISGEETATRDKQFEYEYKLQEGENTLTIYAEDSQGNKSRENTVSVICDTTPPEIITDPVSETVNDAEIIVKGTLSEPAASFKINSQSRKTGSDNTFISKVLLNEGMNKIKITAADAAGNEIEKILEVNYEKTDASPKITDAVTYSKRIDGNITIDGSLSDEEWNIDNKAVKVYYGGETNNVLNFGTAWNDSYLYVGVDVRDEYLSFANGEVYNNDCVEVFINGDGKKSGSYNNTDRQLFIGYSAERGQLHDNGDGIKTAWRDTEYGYQAEMAIPWALFNITPQENLQIGFDVLVDDNDYTESRESIVGWCGTSSNWESTSGFGTLVLCTASNVQYKEKDMSAVAADDPEDDVQVTEADISVYANDIKLEFPAAPFMVSDRVMIPVRAVAETFNAAVDWNEDSQSVTIFKNGREIILTIDSMSAYVDGKEIKNDVAPMLVDDTTFVPLRFISEGLGLKVTWDGSVSAVYISGVK